MKNLLASICLTILMLSGSVGVSSGADLLAGYDAYDRRDYATALQEWLPLAEQGQADAQFNVGYMYGFGTGVPKDDEIAAKWYALAAEQKHIYAQYYLSLAYQQGWGVPKDYEMAIKWIKLSIENGHPYARHLLESIEYYGP